jgi:hypothetical protein
VSWLSACELPATLSSFAAGAQPYVANTTAVTSASSTNLPIGSSTDVLAVAAGKNPQRQLIIGSSAQVAGRWVGQQAREIVELAVHRLRHPGVGRLEREALTLRRGDLLAQAELGFEQRRA